LLVNLGVTVPAQDPPFLGEKSDRNKKFFGRTDFGLSKKAVPTCQLQRQRCRSQSDGFVGGR
jgi:hypothetical protein